MSEANKREWFRGATIPKVTLGFSKMVPEGHRPRIQSLIQPFQIFIMPLPKAYNPSEVEDTIYTIWEKSGAFSPEYNKKSKKYFSIAMPPPNATGTLHIGHAMMLVFQDIMTRYHRMKGDVTLWLPGTDHAAIATQNKVEKILAQEGITRSQLSQKDFLARIHAYVEESRATIRIQIRKMGSSCDWTRERYTLDEGLSQAVTEIFVRMYEENLIYRGYRIVHWCPRCRSTLSDDEVKYREEKTNFYYFRYGPVFIGTARPETKFLDKTIVVNPLDERYKDLVGKEFDVDWIGGKIRAHVIADEIVDKDFGTGAMTITPGHSFEDFDLAQKYHLSVEKIIDEDGNLTHAAGEFAGKNARESRNEIVALLKKNGLLDHVDQKYIHNLPVCYRCETPLEPLPSLQWFISVKKPLKKTGKSLKDTLLLAVDSGTIRIIPKRFEKTYFRWIHNLHDWCISRQIVFGHQVPAWYCPAQPKGCGETIVSRMPPTQCPKCKGTTLTKDTDTLDTWFSSGLWTFSTLGWPKKTKDLAAFHPTSVMETGYDILFFWVARMIMMSYYALGMEPFKIIYLHGLVLDARGKKMSKSKEETQINPLDMIAQFGTDALRMSLTAGVTPGNDLRLGEEKIASYRNFANKLWNISRFILEFAHSEKMEHAAKHEKKIPSAADEWITSRLHTTISRVTTLIEQYRFSQAAEELRVFTWDELADWYLEVSKIEGDKGHILEKILHALLALWHPFMPFVTEVIYQNLKSIKKAGIPLHESLLMVVPWPRAEKKRISHEKEHPFKLLKNCIKAIRVARIENNISPSQKIQALFVSPSHETLIRENEEILKKLARLDFITIAQRMDQPHNALYLKVEDIEIYLLLGMMKVEEEKERLSKELAVLDERIILAQAKLANTEFSTRAPDHIVRKAHSALQTLKEHHAKIQEQIKKLG